MTWDEAESVMRQLQKELKAAEKGHDAFRKAREADEAVKGLLVEQTRLTTALADLRATITAEQATAQVEHATRNQARVDEHTDHEATLAQRRQEIATLEDAAAQMRAAVQAATVERQRLLTEIDRDGIMAGIDHEIATRQAAADLIYAAAVEAQRTEIAALETERRRVDAALRELKATVAALA